MKLELKHLAPYLPYGLKAKTEDGTYNVCGWSDEIGIMLDTIDYGFNAVPSYKILLKSLSILSRKLYFSLSNKNEDIDFGFWYGKNNGLSDKREYIYRQGYSGSTYFIDNGFDQYTYSMMIFFFENHFDVFGLIEQGLAVDINTL